MSLGLTQRQADCLAAIRKLTVDGVSPSYEDIRQEMGVTSNSIVHRLITSLKARGAIDFKPRSSRSIRILADDIASLGLRAMSDDSLRGVIATATCILVDRSAAG